MNVIVKKQDSVFVPTAQGSKEKFNLERDIEYYTFAEIWIDATDTLLRVKTEIFFRPENSIDTCMSVESVTLDKGDIYKAFSNYRIKHKVDHKVRSCAGVNQRMFPLYETRKFIKGYLNKVIDEYYTKNRITFDE